MIVVIVSLIGLAVVLPQRNTPWPQLTAFIPADDTGLALIDMITAMLLIGQFVQLRTPSLLPLACGYLFACFSVIAHLLSYAESLRALRPELANPQSTAWIGVFWHGLFPIFVLTYALLVETRFDRPVSPRRLAWLVIATVAVAIGFTAFVVWAATAGLPFLPALQPGGALDLDSVRRGSLVAGFGAFLCLTGLSLKTRVRRVLDLWLSVVLLALLLDIVIGGGLTSAPFNFGGYAARIFGLLAASIVLSALLLETGQLYARLSRTLAEMHAQTIELDRSEAALRQAQKMEMIGQITGGVAHDFNNLLTVVIGSLDLIQRHPDDTERTVRRAGLAIEAANRGAQLTKQLLAFSRRQALRPEIVNPNQLIREFEALLRQAVGEAVDINFDFSTDIPPVCLDPAQFQTAILNLAVNARDAMAGIGALTIRTSRVTPDHSFAAVNPGALPGEYVLVSVGDTGCGMDDQTIAQAFEPFFTTKEVGKGSGLGLSQVYGFAKSAQGHVAIRSTPGAGATVELYLPRTYARRTSPGSKVAGSEVGETWDQPSFGNETILIVEDEAGVRDTTADSLIELGYSVIAVADAAAALDALGDGAIDLVFSDIVMPGGTNGAELAVKIRAIHPDMPILLTSGYSADAVAKAHGIPDDIEIIPKPYRHDELAGKLRQLLDLRTAVADR